MTDSRSEKIRRLIEEYPVTEAEATAQRVIAALRDEGLAVTGPMGTFVRHED
jgi:hypothetical protein